MTVTLDELLTDLRAYWATMNKALKAVRPINNVAAAEARRNELVDAANSGFRIFMQLDTLAAIAATGLEPDRTNAQIFLDQDSIRQGQACCAELNRQINQKVVQLERAFGF